MSIFEKMVEYFITLNKKMKRWQRAVSLLSAVVVFTTTYALILPAITLDKNTADEQPGIEVAASENNADESGTVYESAPEEAPAEEAEPEVSEDNASEGGQQEDAEVTGQDETEENAQADTDSADTAAPAENAESAETTETTDDAATAGTTVEEIAAETGKSVDEIKLITEDTQLIYRGDDYVVYADFGESAKLPVGVQLDVREITKESDPEVYQAYYDKALSQMQDKYDENTQLSFARFYDITFKYEGMEVEPSGNVNVRIEYKQAVEEEKTENVDTVHFDKRNDEQAEVIDSNTKGSETSVEAVEFESDQFSVYGVVGSATIEKTVLASDGNNYNISVSYGPDAGVPEGAELKVEEIADRSKEYNEYLTQTEDTLGWEAGTATYARFFDITIVDKDGGKVDIQAPVDVKIELADKEESSESNLQVVHFGKETEVVEASTEGSAVSFAANGFSVYAVVGDGTPTVDEARMAVNFYNGTERIATVYIKNGDTPEELEKIFYDPGAGTMHDGELFKGWTTNPDYKTADADSAMTIENIKTWAEGITAADSIKEGDSINYYAMVYHTYSVNYKDESGATIQSEALIFSKNDTRVDYTINEPYTPKEQDEAFKGWHWSSPTSDAVIAKDGSQAPFDNGTEVSIGGNVTFTVNVPKGYWLVFNANGDGASYTPPQFVESGNHTAEPAAPARAGYEFEGWFTDKECTTPFTFDGELDKRTEIFAKWTPVRQANYSVVIWTQNLAGTDYDFKEAITLTGNVGTDVNTVVSQGSGNGRYARINGTNKQYTGFHLDRFDQNVRIVPEGTTVVNVYYDRIEYSVKFYYARTANNNNQRDWYVATAISTNQELQPFTSRTTWSNTSQRRTAYGPSTQYEVNGNYRYYYFTITALYGQNISDQWPRYADFPDLGNYELISWWMMHSAKSWGGAGGGKDTVKGIISVMDEQLLGDLTSSDGNFLIARYSNSQPNLYNYKIWKELPDGFDVPTGADGNPKPTRIEDGVRYYLDDILIAKANSDPGGIHQPSYKGFDEDTFTYSVVRDLGGGKYEYDVEMYYDRNKFKINYMDGLYFDGNGVILDDKTGVPLKESGDIYYESDIHSYNKGGENYYAPERPGYVFAGWYTDEACQHEAVFEEVPDHNVTVYAKWVQKQYRVFMHPNVPTSDGSLDWGGQSMSFRVTDGEKIAGGNQIYGTRDDYELIGWYTDPRCTKAFNFDAYVLNESTVTTDYDKTEDTELDRYGNPAESGNKDALNNRFWITKKLDLYAKWRAKLQGANGINVIYDPGDGINPPTDHMEYLDNSEATAGAASTPNDNTKQFKHWVVQTWNGTKFVDTNIIVYPGDTFTVLKENAKVEPYTDPDRPAVTNKYTVQLRAEYGDKDAPTPTHIYWYANNGTGRVEKLNNGREFFQINEAVPIKPSNLFSYEDHVFLGWARVSNADGQDRPDLDKDDLFLTYHEEDGGYYTALIDGVETRVSRVAADEVTPYHDLYAVWEKKWGYLKIGKHFDVQEFYLDGKEMEEHWKTLEFTITNSDGDYIKLKKETEGPNAGNYILDEIVPKESVTEDNPAPTITLDQFKRETGSDTEHQYFLFAWLPIDTYKVEENHQQADELLTGYSRESGQPYSSEKKIANSCTYGDTDNIGGGEARINNSYRGSNNYAYLKVEKEITGNAPASLTNSKEFYFIVKNESLNAYLSTGHDLREFTTDITKAAVFSIKQGDVIKYDGNPVNGNHIQIIGDNKYSIIELSSTTTPAAKKDPNIDKYDWTPSVSPERVTADKDSEKTITITNDYRSQFGSIKLLKLIDPTGEEPQGAADHEYQFTVKTLIDGAEKYINAEGAAVDSEYVFKVKPGEANAVTVPDLNPGTYTVTEKSENPDPYPSYTLTVSMAAGETSAVGNIIDAVAAKGIVTTVTATNKYERKTAKVKFIKVDEKATKENYTSHTLSGAEFTFDMIGETSLKNLISGNDGVLKEGDTAVFILKASDGDEANSLAETKAPEGYNKMADTVKVTVSATASGISVKALSSSGGNLVVISPAEEGNPYIVLIPNNPGVELPNSGGSGTTLYTLGGLMLVIASALMYGFRMRRGERRFR